jgi:glutamine---fructose-6-phosphate transaminase (isomerizing)
MCGVFGLVIEREARFDAAAMAPLIRDLYRISESRGKEASGLALHVTGRAGVEVRKAAVRGRRLIASPDCRRMLAAAAEAVTAGSRVVVLGHTRMVTNGDPSDNGNNQPVVGHRVVALHNGIITNEDVLWARDPDLPRLHEVDTELVVRLVERGLTADGRDLQTVFIDVAADLSGANTLAVLDGWTGDLALGTANGSLYLASDATSRVTVFASEEPILRRVLAGRRPRRRGRRTVLAPVHQLEPDRMLLLAGGGPPHRPGTVPFGGSAPGASGTPGTRGAGPRQPTARIAEVSRSLRDLAAIDHEAIAGLRRCTRCVLPETFPGIRFDADGVCDVCARYRPPTVSGLESLRARIDGRGKVLFPLSGGRDSCYGLHVAVRELGLDVVAFTYDWGMVTDLARRNISRMCGALGVEHVLVSADIVRKRSNIRKNVSAWLDRPSLGTIPLFMAGDKQFFFHAQRLRRQHRAQLILFSMNPYERTDFKVGFAGVSDGGGRKARHYDLDLLGKLGVLRYYASEMLRNRGFLNASLTDSATGYLSYYMIPKDFASIFDHIEWREDVIDRVLREEYDWETSPDSATTWRVGDGTAPFYNYLYLRIAGFSENDALRSNQIRSGHISRDWAMTRRELESAPRLESLAWYLETIGLDAVDVISRVNRIPALYRQTVDGAEA